MLLNRHLTAVDFDGRELVHKAAQYLIYGGWTHLPGSHLQRPLEHVLACLRPVLPHQQVQHLVNQPQRVDVARANSLLREGSHVPPIVDMLREDTRGVEVGENDIARQREQAVVKLVAIARPA